MDKEVNTSRANRSERVERVIQRGFRGSREYVNAMARKTGGAAITVYGGEVTIGGPRQDLITQESDPKLYIAYQKWLANRNNSEG